MRFIPIVLSLIVLAAHFLRGGGLLLVLIVLALLALLPVRKPWVARGAQLVLALGVLEWTRTLVMLAIRRLNEGQPYLRLVLILAVVIAVTLWSAVLFESAPMRRRYGLGQGQPRQAAEG